MDVIASSDLPYLKRLEQFVRRSLEHQADCRPLFEALLTLPGQFPVPGTTTGDQMLDMHRRYLRSLEAMIAAGEAEGILRPGARMAHAVALAALLEGYSKVAWMGGVSISSDPASEILSSFLDGSRNRGGV